MPVVPLQIQGDAPSHTADNTPPPSLHHQLASSTEVVIHCSGHQQDRLPRTVIRCRAALRQAATQVLDKAAWMWGPPGTHVVVMDHADAEQLSNSADDRADPLTPHEQSRHCTSAQHSSSRPLPSGLTLHLQQPLGVGGVADLVGLTQCGAPIADLR
jgi:hypothetical protein